MYCIIYGPEGLILDSWKKLKAIPKNGLQFLRCFWENLKNFWYHPKIPLYISPVSKSFESHKMNKIQWHLICFPGCLICVFFCPRNGTPRDRPIWSTIRTLFKPYTPSETFACHFIPFSLFCSYSDINFCTNLKRRSTTFIFILKL